MMYCFCIVFGIFWSIDTNGGVQIAYDTVVPEPITFSLEHLPFAKCSNRTFRNTSYITGSSPKMSSITDEGERESLPSSSSVRTLLQVIGDEASI